jgi:hypothetical protein
MYGNEAEHAPAGPPAVAFATKLYAVPWHAKSVPVTAPTAPAAIVAVPYIVPEQALPWYTVMVTGTVIALLSMNCDGAVKDTVSALLVPAIKIKQHVNRQIRVWRKGVSFLW